MNMRHMTILLTCVIANILIFLSGQPLRAWPDLPVMSSVYVRNLKDHEPQLIQVKDGVNLSGMDLTNAKINLELGEVKNCDFSNADLSNADLRESTFINCSFKNARMYDVNAYDATFINCDFSGAYISQIEYLMIPYDDFIKTYTYKHKMIIDSTIEIDMRGSNETVDLSGFILSGSSIRAFGKRDNIDLTGAVIKRFHAQLPYEKIATTADYQNKSLERIRFVRLNLENVDFSDFVLYGCSFAGCDMKNVNFTNTVISECDFFNLTNLTLDQIKSTWNYKTGNMKGISLPEEIQKQLDEEEAKQ